jgi:GNAT superfamily N-acetyltransferase
MIEIAVLLPSDARVQAMIAMMRFDATATFALLFGGDRWSCVDAVALAALAGRDVGIATLAPTDEDGGDGPDIIGVWVEAAHRRQGIGSRLILTLAAESQQRYGASARFDAITPAGWRLAQAALRAGPFFVARDRSQTGFELP